MNVKFEFLLVIERMCYMFSMDSTSPFFHKYLKINQQGTKLLRQKFKVANSYENCIKFIMYNVRTYIQKYLQKTAKNRQKFTNNCK